MRIKICGITQPSQGVAISKLGAHALGFICVSASPRYVTPSQIRTVVEVLPPTIAKIGVFANTITEEIARIVTNSGLTGVQLHGDESPAFCQQLRHYLPDAEIIKALRIHSWEALQKAQIYSCCVDTLLLDAYHPQQLGGTGKTLNWEMLKEFSPPKPWFLAGGLTPDNILDALSYVHPHGIDLSSGVEWAPGDKDIDKVAKLFAKLKDEVSI
ncbi:phosphoribosylanthranilate isomerase [Calothrix rhizosoleniae]|uniref:phosphoribosylanthranilate isomerase n=1 Tax=Calothrix rhizosoleniae TaxID=888997 RepID=UPI000B4977D8|nr:phosphoribosylanthranilate isomerase [Calothrix rhizosoleniae]